MTGLKDLGISTGGTGLGDLGLKPKPRDTTGTSLADLGLTAARDTDAFAFHSPERTPFLQSDYASPQMRGLIKRGMEEPGTATMRDPAEAAIDDVIAQQVNKGLLADTMGALQRIPGNVAAGYQQYQSSQDLSAAIDLYENIDKIEDAGTEFSAPTRLNDRAVLRDPNLVASVNRADLSPAQRERVKAEPESVDQILVQGLSQRAQSLVESANAMRKKANAAEQAPETQALAKADSFADGWDIFWQNPVGIIADIGSQSATQSVMIAVGGAIGGGATGGPVGAGIGSALSAVKTVYASSIVDAMRRSGVDITDPKAIRAASKDDGLMAKVKRDAAAYTAVISAGAGLAGGIAGVNLAPKGISNAFAKEAVDLFGQMTAQAGIGAGSEAGALGASGQKITAGPLIMEAVGEAATAPIEVAGIAATARKNGKATKPKKSLKRGNRSMPAADSALQKMGNREYDAITDAEVNALLAAGYVQENPDSYVKLHGTGLEITKQGAARFRGLMTEQPGQPDAAQQGTSLQPEQDDGQRTGMQPQRGQRVQRADEVSGDATQAAQQRGAEQRPEPSAGQGAQGADEITQPAPPDGGANSQGAQITRQQFYADPDNAGIDHEQVVAEALARGERVAPEVMWNYQDLAEQYPGIEPTQSVTPEPAETLPPQESVTARTVDQYEAAGLPVYEQTLADLSVSQDVPQFKDGADDEGVVEPLAGEIYDRVDTGAVQVWERLDGRREVISGRHRRHKGLESGETTIPAQLHREADGFTAEDAAILDASLNIRDGQGTVKDYANFFKNANITEEAAESKGLLGRKKGRDGFIIGRRGSDETIASLNAGQITAEAAARISEAAPNNEAQQALGMATVQAGKPITEAVNTILAVQSMQHQGTVKQGDLYGFDASAIERARDMGRVASREQREIRERISAVRGAANRPEKARELGVNVKDPEAVKQRITELQAEAARWDNWHTDPELVAQIRAELRGEPIEKNAEEEVDEAPPGPGLFGVTPNADQETAGPGSGRVATQKTPDPGTAADGTGDGGSGSEPFDYAGLTIYPIKIAGKQKWAIEAPANRVEREAGRRNRGGDRLADTPEQAREIADEIVAQEKQRAQRGREQEAKDKQRQDEEEDEKADTLNGFLDDKPEMQRQRIKNFLNKPVRIKGVETTRRKYVEASETIGTTKEEIGSKTTYLVNGFDLGKTAFDYASFLSDQKPDDPVYDITPERYERAKAVAGRQVEEAGQSDVSESTDSEPLLSSYSADDLTQREREQNRAQSEQDEQRRQAEQRAEADRNVDAFSLTGSDAEAEQAMAAGQDSLFEAPNAYNGARGDQDARNPRNLQRPDAAAAQSVDVDAAAAVQVEEQGDQLDLFIPQDSPIAGDAARFATQTMSVQVGTLPVGTKTVRNEADAAHVVAALRKNPQEKMYAIVTDKDGRVLTVIQHSMGTPKSASVSVGLLAGHVRDVPQAANVWFTHNHPSGQSRQSKADLRITRELNNVFDGSGIATHGMIVVAPGGAPSFQVDGLQDSQPIEQAPRARRQSVPVSEARFKRIGSLNKMPVSSPQDAIAIIRDMPDTAGVYLLDNKHRPVGFLPMTPEQMERLRTGDKNQGSGQFLHAIAQTNASALMVRVPDAASVRSAQNVEMFANAAGLRYLDTFYKNDSGLMVSAQGAGFMSPSSSTAFFSRAGQTEEPQNLYVAHNLTEENIKAADKLGGLAAPSLAVGNIDAGAIDNFGEITLLASPDILDSPKVKTFDADVYSPRQPRPQFDVNTRAWNDLIAELKASYPGNEMVADIDAVEREGAEGLWRSDALKYQYLQSVGKAPALKRQKVEPEIRRAAKDGADIKKIAEQYYRRSLRQVEQAMPEEATSTRNSWFGEDGKLTIPAFDKFRNKVMDYRRMGGYDLFELGRSLDKKLRNQATARGYGEHVEQVADRVIEGAKLFRGFTNAGNRRYSPYTMDNVLREMTRELQGGENWNYGAGSVRAKKAKQFRSRAAIQKSRDRIVSTEEMQRISDESQDRLTHLLTELQSLYRFEGGSFGYMDDASSAIADGPAAMREAFDMTPEAWTQAREFTGYLSGLPTAYFEAKAQRRVGLDEFDTAVVPRGADPAVVQRLKDDGLTIRYYKRGDAADRARAVRGARRGLFFSRGNAPMRRDPAESAREINQGLKDSLSKVRKHVPVTVSTANPADIYGAQAAGVEGVYDNGEVTLFAGNLSSPERAREILRHEAVGHFSMERMLGDGFQGTIDRVRRMHNNKRIAPLVEQVRIRYPRLDTKSDTFQQELIAVMAEGGVDMPIMRRMLAAMRRFLRSLGLGKGGISEMELRALLARAGRDLAAGGRVPRVRLAPTFSASSPTFYSGMAQVMAEKLPKQAPAAQMRQAIEAFARKGQIKAEELEWSGIIPWLDAQDGKVTKAELLEAFAGLTVRTEESIKSGRSEPAGGVTQFGGGGTRYGEYTLPGGESYTELLIQLPSSAAAFDPSKVEIKRNRQSTTQGTAELLYEGERLGGPYADEGTPQTNYMTPDAQWIETARRIFERGEYSPGRRTRTDNRQGNYIGSHFDEPNILAHLRMNLRNDGQTLFIEEIQSDWHQAGRKNDYTTQSQDEIRTRIVEIDNRLAQIRNEPAEQVGREEQALFAERGRLQELVTGAVPDAPFKKTWPLLALKRAIRYASDNGVTEIAWTTGAQQAKRYWGRELDSPAVRRWNAISEPQSVRKELFDYFGSELASVAPLEIVDAPMLAALNNNQVRRAVVKSIPVNVVNILSDNGFTPDQLVSEPNMVGEALAIDSRSSVARGLAGALQLVGARLRTALNRVLSSESTPRDQELFATIRASDLNPSVVMRLLSTLGSTNSRARLSSSGLGSTASGTESPGVTPSTKVDLATVGGELSPAELAEFLNRHALIIADSTGKPITDLLVQPPPGAGMRGFYDETLPRMANKYIKKWGSRVAITRIGTTPQSDERAAQFRRTTADIVDEYQAGRMPLDELNALTGSSLTTAELAGRSQDDIVTAIAGNEQHSTEVHGFPITPQMREAALAGQPLFSRPTTMDSAGEQAGARAEPDAAADPAADAEQSAYKRINQRPARGDMRLIARDADGQSVAAAAVKDGEWLIVSTDTDLLGYGIKRAKTRKQAEAIMSQGGRTVSLEVPGKTTAEQADMGSSRLDLPEGGYVKNAALTFQYRAQDKFNSLKRIQSAAERQEGDLADNMNPYMLESIHAGRTQARTEAFEEEQLEPLLTGLQQAGIGMKPAREHMADMGMSQAVMDRFGDMPVAELYLYARHAPEANAELEAINPGEHALSGMSDAHAAQIIKALKASEGAQGFQDLAQRIDEITGGTRQILVDGGLESRSTVEEWGKKYPSYVPLKGAADKAGPDGTGMPKRGRGFDIRGPESRRRLGRVTPASDILANVVAAHQAAITRAEKNRVGQAMLRFAQTHPDERLWTIDQPQRKRRLDPVTDTVQVHYDPKPQVADNVFVVKVGGVEHHIDFNESSVDAMRMAKSMKNLSAAETNLLVKAGLRMNRFLSMMSTSLNPEFVITNFARDLQTVAVNLNDSEAHDLKYKILKDAATGKAYRAIRRYHKGGRDGEMERYYHDFVMDGAETGWTQGYASMEDLSKDLAKKIANMQPGAWPFAKRATRNLFELIGDMNSAVENGIRLSTYMQARKAGVSRDKAAALAKNISVNFNRRGDWGNGLNAAYLFYNAATQGTARIAQAAARSKKARRIMYGAVALGVVMDLANRWIADDDEDGRNRYDQIPEYVKRMNWIVMLPENEAMPDWVPDWALGPNGDYIKFPMPYGYNMLSYTGQKIGRAMSAAMGDIPNYSVADEAMGFGIGIMSAFNPVGYASSWLQIGMPTIADPFVQWAENKNWAGIPIHPEATPYGPPPPNYTLYYSGARAWSKWVTEQLNMATGGTAVTPGAVNISPELLDHFTDFAMGGAGRFLLDTADLPFAIKGAVEGTEELEAYTIPFVGKIYGTPRDGASRDLFYDRRTELTYLKNEFEAARKNGDRARIRALRQNRTGQAKLLPLMEHTDKRVRALRKQHDAVVASAMAEDRKRQRLSAIEKSIETAYHRFNRRYAESVYE